jgi:hypothetical protein
MLTPKTKLQSLLLILVSFTISFIVAIAMSLQAEMILVGTDGTINWNRVFMPVLTWLITNLITLAAILGVPAWGTEQLVYKSKKLGTERSMKVLDAATKRVKELDSKVADDIVSDKVLTENANK